jgi:hypothetical protein
MVGGCVTFWRKIAGSGLSLAMVTAAGVTLALPAQASINNSPGYFHWENTTSHTCMDAQFAGPGTRVLMWRCLNTEFEEWKIAEIIDPVRPNAITVKFINHAMNMCLAVDSETPGNGSPVVQQICDISDQKQLWLLDSNTFPPSRVHSFLKFEQVLDVDGGRSDNGVPLQTWEVPTSRQYWRDL